MVFPASLSHVTGKGNGKEGAAAATCFGRESMKFGGGILADYLHHIHILLNIVLI